MVCSDHKRDTLFVPCGHIVTCSSCASRVKKCLLCKEPVVSRSKVGCHGNNFCAMFRHGEGEGVVWLRCLLFPLLLPLPPFLHYTSPSPPPGRWRNVWCVQRWLLASYSNRACTWWPVKVSSLSAYPGQGCVRGRCLVYVCFVCAGCASVMKKCVKCRTPIEKSIPFIVCCGGKRKWLVPSLSHGLLFSFPDLLAPVFDHSMRVYSLRTRVWFWD